MHPIPSRPLFKPDARIGNSGKLLEEVFQVSFLLFGFALRLLRCPFGLPGLVASQGTGGLLDPPLGFMHRSFDLISATAFLALVFHTIDYFLGPFLGLIYRFLALLLALLCHAPFPPPPNCIAAHVSYPSVTPL